MKKLVSAVLCAAMVVSVLTGAEADAAKKPKLSKSKVNVKVGTTAKVTVKNLSKKTKVTWKTNKKKIASIVKKKTKKNYVTIKGEKPGNAKITAVFKLGKKTKKLTCNVSVKKKNNTSTDVTTTPGVNSTATPIADIQTGAPTAAVSTNIPGPTNTPGPTKTPKPTAKPTPSADCQIYKTYTDVVVDGNVELAWDFVEKMPISYWKGEEGKTAQTSNAYAKVMWTESYMYILVEAEDSQIDTTASEVSNQDMVDLFFDEYNNKEEWGAEKKKNEFNYRTVLDFEADKVGDFTDKNQWDGEKDDVKTAIGKTDKGYAVEYSIKLHEAPVEEKFAGIEIQINDAADGEKNGTWNLFANIAEGSKTPYESTLVFGECQYGIKRRPKEIDLDFSNPASTNMQLPDQFSIKEIDEDGKEYVAYYDENNEVVSKRYTEVDDEGKITIIYKDKDGNVIDEPIGNRKASDGIMNTKARYDSENGLVYCETANNIVIYFPEGLKVYMGEKAAVRIEGTYTVPVVDEDAEGDASTGTTEMSDSSTVFRTWLVDSNDKKRLGDSPVTVSNPLSITYGEIKAEDGKFVYNGAFKANGPDKAGDDGYVSDGTSDALMIKAPSYNSTIGNLVLSKVVLTVYEPITEIETPGETETPDETK